MSSWDRAAVYHLYGRNDMLLYVGMTCSPRTRFEEHRRGTPWWPDVERHTVTWYETRAEAAAAERHAIDTERPLHNRPIRGGKRHAPRKPPPGDEWIPLRHVHWLCRTAGWRDTNWAVGKMIEAGTFGEVYRTPGGFRYVRESAVRQAIAQRTTPER